ncbi:MAG TPA: gamma-glutamyltransferase family protein [Alphaproteobacteria bacterium]|nr:gamma-glutamyltransferase family protein [Alphaproteobacteria bacterium]
MFTTRPEIRGTFGAVASTHWLASAIAMGMLERGGNAFDAAVAAGFVLQVVEPHLNGPLGEVPILTWDARKSRVDAICGQGVTPAAATIEAFRGLGLDMVPGTGLLAACVPGAFDAWMRLLRDYGTMNVADVLAPAIHYAGAGYPLVWRIPAAIAAVAAHFSEHWPTSAAVYLPNGNVPATGSLFRNPALAEMYRRIAEEAGGVAGREAQIERARNAWSQGFVAEAIDRFCRTQEIMDTSGRRHSGLLTGDDMARWEATVERPLTLDYHGYTVAKCGAWCQGPVLLQQLALLKGFDLAAMDPVGADFVHTVTECAKLAFADREAWYGDPDFVDVPVAALLSDAYADKRRKLVGREASLALRPGSPDGRVPCLPARSGKGPEALSAGAGEQTMAGVGEPTTRRHAEPTVGRDGRAAGDTCHVDVIDRWGNMVAATPSGGWLASSPVIPELGCGLTTRGQMFWLEEGLPTSLAPRKRPRTTLTPSLALKDGAPYMAFGTPGGDQQDQWSTLLFLHHVHHSMNLQAAIDAPAFHTEHMPSSFWPRAARPGVLVLEGRFAPAVCDALKARGHVVETGPDWSEGRLCACAQEQTGDGKILKAAANARGMQGYALGR